MAMTYTFAALMLSAPCMASGSQFVDMGKPTVCSPHTAETMPCFPGGEKACMEYIDTHLVYPEKAKENGITGKIFLQFIVTEDGSIKEAKVVKRKLSQKAKEGKTDAMSGASAQVSAEETERRKALKEECGKLMEEAALKVVRDMPKWEPGTQNGKAISVKYMLPVRFTL